MTATSHSRSIVTANDAPAAIGPYSHAVRYDSVLYCSGALPVNPADGTLVQSSPAGETTQCLTNLVAVCRAAGAELADAVRLTVYTTQLDRFAEINEAYAAFFSAQPPARVTIGVAALPKGASVEIDAIVAVVDR